MLSRKRKFATIVIILLFISLWGLSRLLKGDIIYNSKYYFTKIALKYQLIDYGILGYWLSPHLNSITEKTLSLLNEEEYVDKSIFLNNPPYFENAEDPDSYKFKLYNIALLLNKLERQRNDEKQKIEAETLKFKKTINNNKAFFEVQLPENREVINKKLIIRNNGVKRVENPKVIVNDKKKWFDLDSIVQSIIKPGMTEEEKALSIWNFIKNSSYNFSPATGGSELHDPVIFLNVYGYGYCDDKAANLHFLAKRIGLKSRVWGLSGHVVSEVYFQNGWHLLDPEFKVFYLEKDNKTIASVNSIADNPELIYRVANTKEFSSIGNGKSQGKLYSTKWNNYIAYKKSWMTPVSKYHNMNFNLRPGESFLASWKGDDRYISYGQFYTKKPPVYGKGQFIYNPALDNNTLMENIHNMNNLEIYKGENNDRVLTARKPNEASSFIINFSTPYPITGASLEIDCFMQEDKDLLKISFSKDGKKWWEMIDLSAKQQTQDIYNIRKDFTNYFPNGYAPPLYEYSLKFEFLSTKPLSLAINRLKFITNTQLAPNSLPELERGKNTISYISDSSEEQLTEIEFYYSLGKHYRPFLEPPKLNTAEIVKEGFRFSWSFPENRDININSIEYNFLLSSRDDFLIPLSPNFDIVTGNSKFLIERKWLNSDREYYWKVRSRYKDEPWGKFSKPGQLAIDNIT